MEEGRAEGRAEGQGQRHDCMSGWQLTRHGTLARDDGAQGRAVMRSHWVIRCSGRVDGCGWG